MKEWPSHGKKYNPKVPSLRQFFFSAAEGGEERLERGEEGQGRGLGKEGVYIGAK